jgi:hypothetical protein
VTATLLAGATAATLLAGGTARPELRAEILGLLLVLLESDALGDRKTRVAGEPGIPRGAQAPQIDGAPTGLVEFRVLASFAEPWRRTEIKPCAIRHDTQDICVG